MRQFDIFTPPSRVDDVLFDMTRFNLGSDVGEHMHDCIEITVVLGGSATHISQGEAAPLRRGDVCITQLGGSHGMTECRDLLHYNLSCTHEILEKTGVNLGFLHGMRDLFCGKRRTILFHLDLQETADTTRILDRMYDIYERRNGTESGELRAQFAILLCLLASSYSRHHKADSSESRLDRALEYLNLHYREPVALEELAKISSLSGSQFVRLFRRKYEMTPIAYQLHLRMNEARRLLCESELSVTEISYKLGFSNGNYFTHFFRKRHGESPSDFRKEYQRQAK